MSKRRGMHKGKRTEIKKGRNIKNYNQLLGWYVHLVINCAYMHPVILITHMCYVNTYHMVPNFQRKQFSRNGHLKNFAKKFFFQGPRIPVSHTCTILNIPEHNFHGWVSICRALDNLVP